MCQNSFSAYQGNSYDFCFKSVFVSVCLALGGPTEEELLELLDQCDLALTRTPDMSPAVSLTHSSRNSTCR